MEKPENNKYPTTDGKYHVGKFAHCKIWRKCKVKLNKTISLEERMKAVARCGSRLGATGVNRSKVYSFLKVIEKENPHLKYLREKK
ncbi:hypothetical protein DSCA_61020 [Desulfosarcina alkanivorans]|uniref:Uncharacterized protein n=2 Tax=Desulfosarcina alkanivorans TaxID=571177 RepID=A0A5K7YQV7_9BACT|nr:hypothetical protein DSCA_61020 [Desulfosarcina alkanivorans]